MKSSKIFVTLIILLTFNLFSSAALPATITVTSPNGGEAWLWNTSRTITWSSTGSIANVKIEYSLDGGTSWSTAAASYSNSGSMSLTVPYMPTTKGLIRISDASNASVFDVSDAIFYIVSDSTEPNNTSSQAFALPLNTTTANLVFDGGSVGDVDWYKFFVPSSEAGKFLKVNVKVTSPYPPSPPAGWTSDIDFDLYDGSLRLLESTFSSSDNETLYLPAVASGWYYIHVGSSTTNYADSNQYAHYSVDIETAASFGVGVVSGRIVNGSGQGIQNVNVRLYYDWGVSFPTAYTDASGNFAIANLPRQYGLYFAGENGAGSYVYQLDANVVAEYYSHKKAEGECDPITLTAGQTLNIGTYAMTIGAIVTGRMTNNSGGPLSNGPVTSFDSAGNVSSYVYTDSNGNYTLAGVPVGGARLRFRHTGWTDQYYNNHPSLGTADVLSTQSGVTISGINAQLTKGGMISGTVKDKSGSALGNISVQLYAISDSTFYRHNVTTATGTGTYSFYNVMAGDYKVYFNSAPSGYVPIWYANATSFAGATTVHVNENQTTSGIDAQLAAGTPGIKLLQGTTEIPSGGTYDFGPKLLNTTTDVVFTIQNTGNVNLNLSGAISGTNADQFPVNGGTESLAPGASVQFTISFLPTSAGVKSAQLPIVNNVPGKSPYVLNLTGTGSLPTTITVTSPNGGESWVGNSSHAITWTWTGAIPNVKIEYSTNSGSSYTTVVASTANTGTYAWTVPNTPSTTCLIRVSDASSAAVNDVSSAVFTIMTAPSIPAAQRQALIDLYNSTNGASWTTKTNWNGAAGTENTWYGVITDASNTKVLELNLPDNNLVGTLPASLGNLSNLTALRLQSNQLAGSIPTSLGNLSGVKYLYLQSNRLTGSIPSELGNLSSVLSLMLYSNQLTGNIPSSLGSLSKLNLLDLNTNQLTGSIPSELGNLSSLQYLYLHYNELTGSIPSSLGNLRNLNYLYLQSNQLTGSIPTSLTALTALNSNFTHIGYNALHTSDATLITFLNSKESNWASTQTIAPTNVSAVAGSSSVTVSWTPIAYSGDTGGYRVLYATVSGGPYTFYAQTANKSASSQLVSGLNAGNSYYFVVQTRTDAHTGSSDPNQNNQNVVTSENSNEVSATPPIPPTIMVTSPNGGESWVVGSSHAITWTWTGAIPNVKIEYSTNSGSSYTTVAASTANTGTYAWTVPNTPSTTCLVRVSDATTASVNDVSNAVFTIVFPSVTISGTVTLGGAALGNVVMAGFPTTVTTNASGQYGASVDYGWTGTVTPKLAGYTFTPVSTTYTTVRENKTSNYTAGALVCTVNFIGTTGGTISGNTVQNVPYGSDTAAVTAVASAGYQFTGWWGDYSGTANPLVIHAVHGNLNVHVAFSALPIAVQITSPATGTQVSGTVDIQASVTYSGTVSKVEAYVDGVKIGNMTASMNNSLAVDLDGGIAAYLCLDGKLRKVMADGTSKPMLTPDVGVDYFQADSLGGYIAFQKPQTAADGGTYRLMRIDLVSQKLIGIDDDFDRLVHDALASRAIQPDDQGYAYYFVRNAAGDAVLKRWKAGDSPSILWVDWMSILAWNTTPDGQVVVAGETPQTGERWLKRWTEEGGVARSPAVVDSASPGGLMAGLLAPDQDAPISPIREALAMRMSTEFQRIGVYGDKILLSGMHDVSLFDPTANRMLGTISTPGQVLEACLLADGSILFSSYDASAGSILLGLADSVSMTNGSNAFRSLPTSEMMPYGLGPIPAFEGGMLVNRVEAGANPKPQAAPASQASYSFSWNTIPYAAGNHQVTVVATAESGLTGSGTMTVNVFNLGLNLYSIATGGGLSFNPVTRRYDWVTLYSLCLLVTNPGNVLIQKFEIWAGTSKVAEFQWVSGKSLYYIFSKPGSFSRGYSATASYFVIAYGMDGKAIGYSNTALF